MATGDDNIALMWKNHYENLLNCVNNTEHRNTVLAKCADLSCSMYVCSPTEVSAAIKHLKPGKSSGPDGLSAEHFIYSHNSISVLLSMLFTCIINHGYMPGGLMNTVIVPLVKDKNGNLQDSNNYRPIALVNIMSKILEVIVLGVIETMICTYDNQFGFKKGHGTDLAVYALKNTIEYYKSYNSPVFVCFMDASKAFDRVNYWSLFHKLIERNVPMLFVRLLAYWYQYQMVMIRWESAISPSFTVTNGVRQGSILSPHLFALYVDDLSSDLNSCNNGCFINDISINHVFYADDLCILSPSAKGLQNLVDLCERYGIAHDIVFNPTKTQCLVFKPKGYKLHCPKIALAGTVIDYTSKAKYLGVIIHESAIDHDDMLRQLRLLYVRGNTLVRKFGKCSHAVLTTLYRTYCENFYNIFLWFNFSKTMYNKVKVACNNVCRKVFNFSRRDSARGMFVSLGCDNFDVIYRKSIINFVHRMSTSGNTIIKALNCNWAIINGAMWSEWGRHLYLHAMER